MRFNPAQRHRLSFSESTPSDKGNAHVHSPERDDTRSSRIVPETRFFSSAPTAETGCDALLLIPLVPFQPTVTTSPSSTASRARSRARG